MKKVYSFDNTNTFVSFDYLGDSYELNDNETIVPIPDGLYMPIKFNKEAGEWSGLTAAEFFSQNEQSGDVQLSSEEMLSGLTQQLATFQLAQNEINSKLLQQMALMQAEKEMANG